MAFKPSNTAEEEKEEYMKNNKSIKYLQFYTPIIS
jgi:hypothetical protein